jgi:hypothetical protein
MSPPYQERAQALDAKPSGAAKSIDATKGRIRHRLLQATLISAVIIVTAGWLYLLSTFVIWLIS